ncbi:MAG: hypothetical protein D8M59_15355 [Planctomycetes bacterium]|nr:hypothetical protein [Planctomycetota bacterium]NOG55345.1 hypothetical protein [Planctomycetota bacterium]
MTSHLPPSKADSQQSSAPAHVNPTTAGARRFKYGLNVSVLVLALIVVLAVVNWLAADSHLRWDFTASRSYSLSPQTRSLLTSLDEPIEITLLFSEDQAGPLRRQVEDVMREFVKRSDQIVINRIDPLDPRSITPYEDLIAQLQEKYAGEISTYESRLGAARGQVDATMTFIQQQGALLAESLTNGDPNHQYRRLFESVYIALTTTMPLNAQTLLAEVDRQLQTGAGQPITDWQGAAATLRAALQSPGQDFERVAGLYREVIASGDIPAGMATVLPDWAAAFDEAARGALDMAQTLDDLEPLGLTPILRSIRQSNCVLVTTSDEATVIPYEQLFPQPSAREIQEQSRFDLRFAGEGIVASAIRRLVQTETATVVFCHALGQPGAVLGDFRRPGMLAALASRLNELGFETMEWDVLTGEQPVPATAESPVVYFIIPSPPSMSDQQAMAASATLSNTVQTLVDDGESVFFSFYPSFIPGFGQADTWASVAARFGITPDTGRVIFERIPQPGGQDRNVAGMLLNDYREDHVIGAALVGLDTQVSAPIPLLLDGETTEGALPDSLSRWVVLDIKPSARVWAEDQWYSEQTIEPPAEPDSEPYPVIVAAEIADASASTSQRALFVGSGNWFTNDIVNSMSLIDSQIWPTNPGNSELFLNGVCWLAGMDDFIAPSPMTRSISRIGPIPDSTRIVYRWGLAVGLPIVVLAAGVCVWIARRG